jgi:hypothetical protein
MTHDTKDDVLDEVPAAVAEDITPRDLMAFAKSILVVVAVLFALGGASEFFQPNSGVFEACKTILPPIATLVIGFYFGRSN